nr:DUF2382 domain-containing protein [uncultured Sphingosinicella sp.]
MSRSVTAVYKSRAEAEAVAARLTSMGVDPSSIGIAGERPGQAQPGVFDHLAKLIMPETAPTSFRVSAEVEDDQFDEAGRILSAGAPGGRFAPPREITEQTFIFRETAERLVVDKELAVHEELVMRRTADEHVEVVRDSVRRTEFEIERFGADGQTITQH